MSEEPTASGKELSESERIVLGAKLDRELEDFIDSLEKRRYVEGWPEDRWEEEMEKHPFFMKRSPGSAEEMSPLTEGLQQLKFDPELNTPIELATKYKDDGNFEYQHKNYRLAILNYTEALKIKCGDTELEACLYNNRGASHYSLKNYRSALKDSQAALERNNDYDKARKRVADCAYYLQDYELCTDSCDIFLERNPKCKEVTALRKKAVTKKAAKERDDRKRQILGRKEEEQSSKVIAELNNRKIKFYDKKLYYGNLQKIPQPKVAPLCGYAVHMNNTNTLFWPMTFLYPEYFTSDFLQSVSELTTIEECLNELFIEIPDWDKHNKYRPNTVAVYHENRHLCKVFPVDISLSLMEITSLDTFIIYDGAPTFYVVAKGSTAEDEFVEQKLKPIKPIK